MGTIEARLGALPGLEEQPVEVACMSFERVCALSEVPEPGALRVELADVDVAVVRFEGEVYAIEDLCSHAEVPLSEGDVEEFKGAPDHRVLAARLVLRPAHRRTHQPAGHRAGRPSTRSAWRGRTCTSTSPIDDSLPAAASN